jgi:hypothetical protein
MDYQPASVSLEDVTQAAVSGVLRALAARQPAQDFPTIPWPILIGVVLNPAEPFLAALGPGSAAQEAARGE